MKKIKQAGELPGRSSPGIISVKTGKALKVIETGEKHCPAEADIDYRQVIPGQGRIPERPAQFNHDDDDHVALPGLETEYADLPFLGTDAVKVFVYQFQKPEAVYQKCQDCPCNTHPEPCTAGCLRKPVDSKSAQEDAHGTPYDSRKGDEDALVHGRIEFFQRFLHPKKAIVRRLTQIITDVSEPSPTNAY